MIPSNEFSARRQALALELGRRRIDCLLVSAPPNIHYLSGFTGSNALLLLSAEASILFTDPRYTVQAGQQTDCHVLVIKTPLPPAAGKQIMRKKWRRIGFESSRISYHVFSQMEEALSAPARLVAVPSLIEERRMIKSPSEIQNIRTSVQTNSTALDRALRRFKPSMTETDLAAEIEYQMRKLGADKPAFETIVAAGERSALPHARPSDQALGENRLLLIDMGVTQSGYASDMTRVFHLGSPSARTRKMYDAVLESQLAGIAAVRDGVTAGSVDRKVRRVLKSHGLDKQFVHSTGHGLGLEIHEPPRLGKRDETILRPGMAITIEPGVYVEGFGGIRIEDTVLVTANGCEVLTPTTKELTSL